MTGKFLMNGLKTRDGFYYVLAPRGGSSDLLKNALNPLVPDLTSLGMR